MNMYEMYNSAGNVVEALYHASQRLRYARLAPKSYNEDVIAAQIEVERLTDVYMEADELYGEILDQCEHDFHEWLSEGDLRRAERGEIYCY